jgi:CHRD domain
MKQIITVATLSSAIALLFGFADSPAQGATIFKSFLSGDQEVITNPDNTFTPIDTGSKATGIAELVLNEAQTRLEINLQLFGLDLDGQQTPNDLADDITMLHIHRAPFGKNGPVVFGFMMPNSDTNNDLVIDAAAGTIFSAWDLNEGNNTTLLAELSNLFDKGLYFNVHTKTFPGGEIRGQIEQAPEGVPEPGSLLGLGLASGMGLLTLRRRQALNGRV